MNEISLINCVPAKNEFEFDASVAETPSLCDIQARIFSVLDDAMRTGWAIGFTTDEIYKIVKDNPEFCKVTGFPTEPRDIESKFVAPAFANKYKRTNEGKAESPDLIIKVEDKGKRFGKAYGGTMKITKKDGTSISVPVSSWPNPKNGSPGIRDGSYPAIFKIKGHKNQTKPGIIVNDNKRIATIGPNPSQQEQYVADYIHVHCGDTETNRGSKGCVTIEPNYCQEVWDFLKDGEDGVITIERD